LQKDGKTPGEDGNYMEGIMNRKDPNTDTEWVLDEYIDTKFVREVEFSLQTTAATGERYMKETVSGNKYNLFPAAQQFVDVNKDNLTCNLFGTLKLYDNASNSIEVQYVPQFKFDKKQNMYTQVNVVNEVVFNVLQNGLKTNKQIVLKWDASSQKWLSQEPPLVPYDMIRKYKIQFERIVNALTMWDTAENDIMKQKSILFNQSIVDSREIEKQTNEQLLNISVWNTTLTNLKAGLASTHCCPCCCWCLCLLYWEWQCNRC
jgi:hypothetical protein